MGLKRKVASGIMLTLLLIGMLTWAFNSQQVKADPTTWTVDDDGQADFSSIQEAINSDMVAEGDTIYVKAGTYYENVIVNKTVSLIGENRNSTIIDGRGTGTVVQIVSQNVSIINFTIRNAGKVWKGTGYPPSCISGSNVKHVNVKNNTLTDAAACAWFYSSSFVNISDNIVFKATTAGIIGYASSNIVINQNLVDNCGLMGLHLDGSSTNCNITSNTVMNNLEGIEVEKSAGNFVQQNQLIGNNASMVLNQCDGWNSFRENNMTSDWYNLIVWGWTLEAFMHDFDTTNIVNGKTVYYFINSHNLLINPSNYPNIGYLAIVNCTNITISDINLSFNRDGLLMAQSANCSLVNVTLSGNIGPLFYGGLTLFKSNKNLIVNNRISNNSVGVCIYQSNENTFYHNSFVNNTRQVVSNFYSPFSPPSGLCSKNIWDDGYPSGGNYWSDYEDRYPNAKELDNSGVWDTPYVIDDNNIDGYPLMSSWTRISGNLQILEPTDGSVIMGPATITFVIENTGEDVEFVQGDPANRIDLEIEYRSTGGEIYGWGIMFWSTSYYGLTLSSGEKYEQTLVYDPSNYDGSVPPGFIGEAPYGEGTIRLVHWKLVEPGYWDVGEFGKAEIQVTFLSPAITANIAFNPDTLNLKSRGKWITANIELPEDYYVGDIDISTVKLNNVVSAESFPTQIGDYDGDGILDLMVKFNRQEAIAISGVGEATLTITGKVNDTPFRGSNTIRVLSKGYS